MDAEIKGAKNLFSEVIEAGLCSLCGACAGGCPYMVTYRGNVVALDNCTVSKGQCYQYCPHTYTDINEVSQHIFGLPYGEDEIGTVKEIFLARTTDSKIRQKAQDGGTVTTLFSLALSEGMIDAVLETKMSQDKVPAGFLAHNKKELLECAGVSYEPSPVLETLNHLKGSTEKLGIVGVPCQVAGLAKMKTYPPKNRFNMENARLVVGLFCGWSLANGFHQFMKEHFELDKATKFDVPHSPGHTFDVYTKLNMKSVEIEEIRPYINKSCSFCWDMTSEFADISVGSGRTMFKGWNTVIVRSKAGAELMAIARAKKALETQAIPADSLDNLRRASRNKKRNALNNIKAKTGGNGDLLYLGLPRGMVDKLLA
jgi:coenzyme F420 hydrogenase subunit beta